MHILSKTWQGDYLDYHMSANDVRVRVQAYRPLQQVSGVYFDQPRSLIRLWNYLRDVGPFTLARKIRSRWAEKLRDIRFIAIGLGTVQDVGGGVEQMRPGQAVVFVAPCHPRCLERIVLPPDLIAPAPQELVSRLVRPGQVLLFEGAPSSKTHDPFLSLAGWSPFSGRASEATVRLLEQARQMLCELDPHEAQALPLDKPSAPCEVSSSPRMQAGLNAVVFGMGNYAKTCLMPNVDQRIHIACIHEVDPTQIGKPNRPTLAFDTCPIPRPDEKYDVYFIAGYHHTHAPLAVHALRQGAWAVIEKPLVTSHEQLDQLLQAMGEHPGRVFAGYHKRYSPLLGLARQDLRVAKGEPVNCSAIVFEMPLPKLHWYRWPSSRTRLTCNGCHWIEQFLNMNDYCLYTQARAWRAHCGDIHASVELTNGAVMNLVLTDIGSRRVGVQDYVQFRAGDVTVSIRNDGEYYCENTRGIVRRKRISKTFLHPQMYRTISRRILAGQGGDSLESVERPHRLVLDLEDSLPNGPAGH